MSDDFYEILGVKKNATKSEIDKAYRTMAKKYHPDINKEKGSEEKFKKVVEAYEVLKDEQKRQNYDNFGKAGAQGNYGGFDGFQGGGFQGFEDIFGDIFGGQAQSSGRVRQRPGNSIQFKVKISLEECFSGISQTISYKSHDSCKTCTGSGFSNGKGSRTCSSCGGSGMKGVSMGFFSFASTCDVCGGEGKSQGPKCHDCSGTGRVAVNRNVMIEIPRGVETGDVIKKEGLGEAGFNGGRNGDLLIVIEVEKNSKFQRQGKDLFTTFAVDLKELLLDNNFKFIGMGGENIEFSVPTGHILSEDLQIRAKGLWKGGSRGDLWIKIKTKLPKLNESQKLEIKKVL